MTVSAGTTKITQNCNGTLTDFDFSFAIYKEEDVIIILKHIATEAETILVLNTDYTIASDNFTDGGTVSTIKEIDAEIVPYAWSADYSITIMLDLALVQETDLLYGGNFSSEAIELIGDRLTRITQQLDEKINRTLKLRKTSALNNIEIDDLEAGKFIMVNAAGDALEMGDAGNGGEALVSNDPYDKDSWNNNAAIAPSQNAVRDELFDNRFTKGATYSMILGLGTGSFLGLPVSNEAYSAAWNGQVKIAPSQDAVYDKIESIGAGAGDVVGPAANTDDYVPQWIGVNSKTLSNGFSITAKGKELINNNSATDMRSTLGLLSAALRNAENTLTDGSNLPDGHAIKIYGDANWGSGDVTGPGSATDNAIPLFDGVTGKLLQDSTRLIEDVMTNGSNLPDGAAIKVYGDENWGSGKANLTEFLEQTAWRFFYSNTDGDVVELALGTTGQYLKANGINVAPTWAVPAGAGDVVGPNTHAADYIPQWNGTPNSKTLVEGFQITAAGKAILDDVSAAAQRTTLGLASAALRVAEDTLTDGSNLPDGHAIKIYGDANWGGGAGDVVGPATHAASYVPQWNDTPNSKTLIDGFLITALGKSLLSNVTAAAMRSTLGLGSAALRTAEDALTDGANLPDGHAIKTYGDANWSGSGLWTDQGTYIQPSNSTNLRIDDKDTQEWDLFIDKTTILGSPFINKAAQFNLTNAQTGKLGWTIYTEIDSSSIHNDGSVAIYAKAITRGSAYWTAAVHGEVHDRMSSGVAIAGNFEMWNKHSNTSGAYGVISGINSWTGNPGSYYNAQAAFLINTNGGKQWCNGIEFRGHFVGETYYENSTNAEIKSEHKLRLSAANGTQNIILHAANIMKKPGTACTVGTDGDFFTGGYFTALSLFSGGAAGVVSTGAVNSGGAGYRVLRIPN